MAFIRIKKRGNKDYFYLVKTSREGKKVKQTYLKYLGRTRPEQEELDRIINDIKSGK